MKVSLTLTCCFGALLIAECVSAGDADICAKVTCGNHGDCIVKTDGNPVCACHEGYSPDAATGLSCLPISSSKAAVESKPVAGKMGKDKEKQIPPPPAGAQCSVDDHCKHYTVCYEGSCISKSKRNRYLEWSNMPRDELARKSKKTILAGSVLLGVGGAAMIAGLTSVFVGAANGNESVYYAGLIVAPVGMISMVIGGSLLSTGTKMKKHHQRHQKAAFCIPASTAKITLSPTIQVGDNTGIFGFSGRF